MTLFQQLITIAMVISGTVITRFVPFLLFPYQEKHRLTFSTWDMF